MLTLFAQQLLFAQRIEETQEWTGIYVNAKGKRLSSRTDVQLRWAHGFSALRTFLVRTGVQVPLGKRLYAMAGPAVFLQGNDVRYSFGREFRMWEEAGCEIDARLSKYAVRLRAEQRWLEGAEKVPALHHRLRLKTEWLIKRRKSTGASSSGILLGNELLVQETAGRGWYFEHDRITAGIQWYFGSSSGIQLQYIFIPFVVKGDGSYMQRQVFRVNLQFDL